MAVVGAGCQDEKTANKREEEGERRAEGGRMMGGWGRGRRRGGGEADWRTALTVGRGGGSSRAREGQSPLLVTVSLPVTLL